MNQKSDILLVLDLDETLVYAVKEELTEPSADLIFEQYYVYKRPHMDNFLIEASKYFALGIWSSAGDIYVEEIVKKITPPEVRFEFIWGRSKCSTKRDRTYDTYYFEKRLDKLKKRGYQLEKILVVDDTPEKVANNYANAIFIKEFKGDTNDSELPNLLDYLLTFITVENVRSIEKRTWRNKSGGT